MYHLGLYECKALPRQDDAHDTFTRTFNFVQVTVNRLTLLNASREGPEVCIVGETFRKARAGVWGLASRQSRCWARLSRQVKKSLKVEDKRVNEAEKVLFTAAKKLGNPRLAALASRVRLDAFSKVPWQDSMRVTDRRRMGRRAAFRLRDRVNRSLVHAG